MSIPISPNLSGSPSTFNAGGTEINLTSSIYNRPSYGGLPSISGLTTITPKIICSRMPSGYIPFHIMVSATETTHDGSGTGSPFMDLHYEWNFGDPSGTEYFTDYYNNTTVNANDSQQGGLAAYMYRNSGDYTITLTVKGKDHNGTVVSGVTTDLFTVGEYWPFMGVATGGTYTLTFNGQTTSPIPYNSLGSGAVEALRNLSNLSSGDVRYTSKQCIQIVGNYLGTTYSISGDFSGLSGTTGTPILRTEEAPSSGNLIRVTNDFSSWQSQYFDSNYDGSNGTSNGTESRPYTTHAELRSYILATTRYRIAYLKRGSVFSGTNSIKMETENNSPRRFFAYGSGAKPIIKNDYTAGETVTIEMGHADQYLNDIVFQDIEIKRDGTGGSTVYIYANGNGPVTVPYGRIRNIVFDQVNFTQGLATTNNLLYSADREDKGSSISRFHVWNCYFDAGTIGGQSILLNTDQWFSVLGSSFIHGSGSAIFVHHIYPTVEKYQLYRYLSFDNAYSRNFCINTNATDYYPSKYFLCDGSYLNSPQNAIDFSNKANNYSYPGYFDECVIQFCKLTSQQLNPTTQQVGIYGNNLDRLIIRYCDFWRFKQSDIVCSDDTKPSKFWIHHNKFYGGVITIKNDQELYYHYNVFHTNSGQKIGSPYHCLDWDGNQVLNFNIDNNVWYAPNATQPFYNDSGVYTNFSTWQSYGHDLNGQIADPNWYMPQSGIFIKNPKVKVNWPGGFTGLEYYNGSSWVSYTDDSYIILDSGLSDNVTTQFRGLTSDQEGVYEIVLTSSGDSLDMNYETSSFFLTGSDIRKYLVIHNGTYLIIQT